MKTPQMIQSHKSAFGAYATMALLNIDTVLNHIQQMAAVEGEFDDRYDDYWKHPVMECFNPKSKQERKTPLLPEKLLLIEEKLMEHFPFLKIIVECHREGINKGKDKENKQQEMNAADIYEVFKSIILVLKEYRNLSTHYLYAGEIWEKPKFLKMESTVANWVNQYYTIALRDTRERYEYDTTDLAFIQDYRYKKDYSTGSRRMVVDCDFFLSMVSLNGDKEGTKHLSAVGVVQLISLFLEKQYIHIFLSKLPIYGKYGAQSEERRVIRRSMSIHSIRLPKERIQSGKDDMAVMLDMLNELKRCPRELFETLSNSDQARFRIISSDHDEVTQIRHSDRFAQLALQYIDYNRLFKGIRFHVNMGKLRYLFAAEKHCIDGETRVRVLEHPLNGFGRIDEMEELRKQADGTFGTSGIAIRDFEHVCRDDANPDNYPYVVDTFTHYMLQNNRIEMAFVKEYVMPKVVKENRKWYVENEMPTCCMSALELPAMMFHLHLLGAEKTEARIKTIVANYKRLFTALSEGRLTQENIDTFGIARCDMPQKVLDAVNGVTQGKNYRAYVNKTIAELKVESERLIDRLKKDKQAVVSDDNKMGKRGFRQIESGKLAEFLAKDMVKFQSTAIEGDGYGTDRLTGLNYRVLQATLATYNSRMNPDAFEQLKTLLEKAGLTEQRGKNAHPFLYRVLGRTPQNTIEFYEAYLHARRSYLANLLDKVKAGEKVHLPFINFNKSKWEKRDSGYYEWIGGVYSEETPIELPRQMFEAEIKNCLKAMPAMNGIDFEQANVTYLIGEYLKRVCEDDFQYFYSSKRHYRYIDLLRCDLDERNVPRQVYTDIEERNQLWENRESAMQSYREWARRKKQTDRMQQRISSEEFEAILDARLRNSRIEFQKSEKHIRRYKVQDALLFLLAKDGLTRQIDFAGKVFKLNEITPEADKGVLSEVMPMVFHFEKGGTRYTLRSAGMKIKNYGDFYKLIHDRRLSSLLQLLSDVKDIEKEKLDEEFGKYDDCRPKLVELVFDFERIAYERYPELREFVTEDNHFDFGKLLAELETRGLSEQESYILREIRNSFSHNRYPKDGIVPVKELPQIAEAILEFFRQSM